MSDHTTNLTLKEAQAILKEYSCTETKPVESEAEKQRLRQAILLVCSFSEYENLGICADNTEAGLAALKSYLKALGNTAELTIDNLPKSSTPVYIKFNTQKQSHYLDSYLGSYRGVLISCQSEDDGLRGTYGHFPLDLWLC